MHIYIFFFQGGLKYGIGIIAKIDNMKTQQIPDNDSDDEYDGGGDDDDGDDDGD